MQPPSVLSLGSDFRSPSLSSQPPPTPAGEQTSLSGWWVLVGTNPLCKNLSALPSAPLYLCCCTLLRGSEASPPPPPSPSVMGLPSVWKLFLLHSSLPRVQAPSLFFCLWFSFFFCPTQVCGDFLTFWEVWGLLPAFSRCSVGAVPRVDVFLMYLWGGRWSPRLTPPPSWRSLQHHFLKRLILSVLNSLCSFIKDQLSIFMWVYFWPIYSVPLLYLSVFFVNTTLFWSL